MPRPKRLNHPNCWYFIFNINPKKKVVFENVILKNKFIKLLKSTSEKYKLEIHSYCIFNNGYLILIRNELANLSPAMSILNSQYSKFYNRIKNKKGRIFKSRFKSILIEDETYLIQITRYIHLYPIQEKFTKKVEDYEWTSYKIYLSEIQPSSWVKTTLITTLLSGNYEQFLKKGNHPQLTRLLTSKRLPRKL